MSFCPGIKYLCDLNRSFNQSHFSLASHQTLPSVLFGIQEVDYERPWLLFWKEAYYCLQQRLHCETLLVDSTTIPLSFTKARFSPTGSLISRAEKVTLVEPLSTKASAIILREERAGLNTAHLVSQVSTQIRSVYIRRCPTPSVPIFTLHYQHTINTCYRNHINDSNHYTQQTL